MEVEVSRFNASIFELVHRKKNERAFLRREPLPEPRRSTFFRVTLAKSGARKRGE